MNKIEIVCDASLFSIYSHRDIVYDYIIKTLTTEFEKQLKEGNITIWQPELSKPIYKVMLYVDNGGR